MAQSNDPGYTIYKNPIAQMKVAGHYAAGADPASTCLLLNLSNLKTIGAHMEALPPGTRSSFAHCHSKEDEMVYIVQGNCHVWLDGHVHPMSAGDLVTLPAGTGVGHTIINDSDEPVVLFIIGTRLENQNEDKLVYFTEAAIKLRKQELTAKGCWWDDAPKREIGPHNGEPKNPRTEPLAEETTWEILSKMKVE